MKRIFLLFILLYSSNSISAQTSKVVNGEIVNVIDENNKRQGKWIITASPRVDEGYTEGEVIEVGNYVNTRKEGIWKKYYPGGKLKSEIFYVGSRPKGAYTLYYENGQIEEQGNWARSKNTGDFKRYHSNGNVSQSFTFSETGQRTGKQTYFYENGNVRLEGTWQEGLEAGIMKEYYENGDAMSVKNFTGGVLDKASVEVYASKEAIKDPVKQVIEEGKDIHASVAKEEKPNQGTFDGNGYKQLFNANKQIAKDGTFKRYRLMEGKQYVYDDNGLLKQIMIFKEGRYIGDGVIEE